MSTAYPITGEIIQIHSYKHNGHIHRAWKETVVLSGSEQMVVGGNDRTIVTEADGRTWVTREPAICFFYAEHWFNIIAMIREEGVYYYCNISSPFVWDGEALKYIDYDLDIKVFPNMHYEILDEDEYERHRQEMNYPDVIDKILKNNVHKLIYWIKEQKGPFSPNTVQEWYKKFIMYQK
ncbi:nucleoside tri-diphosphate phosphatase [Thermolongibacillus altinsuensis]|uniref:nucleoside tri-diphosphate phosphatase n=1 Tax=Thermolongibacillus altinsuensis TaxID=575256 RepID=UPI002554D9B3|nr:DUF402 domain-containing protein [Thermolongibacillus altinsuensis]